MSPLAKWVIAVLITIAGIAGGWYLARKFQVTTPPPPPPAPIAEKPNLIRVTSPQPDALVTSPLTIEGEARGFWFFEASFPVRLLDGNGREIAVTPAQAQGEWMTTEFVPFKATLAFANPGTPSGTLVLEKDNPSGLPENADELRMPVRFNISASPADTRTIQLYYYNSTKDRDAAGNIRCSRAGLEAVERAIARTLTPVQDSVRLLLKGELTSQERGRGITTEYPLAGLSLAAASLRDGVLTLAFNDPENRTSGGACRAGILWFQVEATARQFGAREVRFTPETLFQP